jgi:hypothetical protein
LLLLQVYGYNAHVAEPVKRRFTFLASLLLASLSPISEMALLCGPEIKREPREFFSPKIQHFTAMHIKRSSTLQHNDFQPWLLRTMERGSMLKFNITLLKMLSKKAVP